VFELVLFEPEIPPNTGNVMRLAANAGARLHLIEPLGFVLTDRRLRRAGLDYEDKNRTFVHAALIDCERMLASQRWFALSTCGTRRHDEPAYRAGDVFLFGPETRGLPEPVLESLPAEQILRVPMARSSRSLNLANTVAIVLYEAWRQLGFAGATAAAETQPTAADSARLP
jgi:tRNA (cytidine/uridine-2'-O-)-methyltransferase